MTTYNSTNPNVIELLEFCETLNSKQLDEIIHFLEFLETELQKREKTDKS